MLPRSQRLQQRKVFDLLYRFGRTTRGTMLTVRYIPFKHAGLESSIHHPAENPDVPSRMTTIVSKKVSRKAVERNRIKRRVRHQLLQLCQDLVPGYCIAVSANRPRSRVPGDNEPPVLLTCSASEIAREVRTLFGRSHLLRDRS